jgi:hypothetical protein
VKTLGFDHDDFEDRVDYRVHAGFAGGALSTEDLFRTFLGVLPLDSATFEERLSELLAQVPPSRGEAEAAS